MTRDDFLKASSTKEVTRAATVQKVVDRFKALIPRANLKQLKIGINSMTGGELLIAGRASADKLRRMASRPPDREVNGKMINPFWYG